MFRRQGEAGEVHAVVFHQIDALAVDAVPLRFAELFCRIQRSVIILCPEFICAGSHCRREDQADQKKEQHGKPQLPGC